ncbi:MAG: ribosome-associated translation inhibitor RaiA [Polyangia bacterium]|jgi:putative sigma-54 modulation protein|nr:ribosome-associated translation inhibitor RaiA [Polyangia bacterium]
MKFSVTFRKMDATDAIKKYAEDKVKKIKRYFPDPIQTHVVLALERHLHRADISITLHNGLVLKGTESSDDMYSSIDQAAAKIEKQVRRYKDKIRSHKPQTGPMLAFRRDVIEEEVEEEAPAAPAQEAQPEALPKVIRSDSFTAHPMSIEEAVMQLNLMNNAFLVFTNSNNQAINVIYRRNDGNYGLIDTAQGL